MFNYIHISEIHKNVESLWLTYGSPMRFWLFQKFIVFVTNPRHMEIIMNGALTADRGQVSSIIDDIVGRPGLFTSRGECYFVDLFNIYLIAIYEGRYNI